VLKAYQAKPILITSGPVGCNTSDHQLANLLNSTQLAPMGAVDRRRHHHGHWATSMGKRLDPHIILMEGMHCTLSSLFFSRDRKIAARRE